MIKLYHTNCPVCKGIEMALKKKNIEYTESTDIEEMKVKGFTHPPVLEVDGTPYIGGKACLDYINSLEVR